MYDYAYNRLRDYPGTGVGLEEARHWHRRAYGGMVCSAVSLLGNTKLNTNHRVTYNACFLMI